MEASDACYFCNHLNNPENRNEFSLVARPSDAIERGEPGAKRVLIGMVSDTLELARKATSKKTTVSTEEMEGWYSMGEKYFLGRGVPEDYREALKWYLKAAEHGHARAQNKVGNLFNYGALPENYAEAAKWYRMAADQGSADAQESLGLLYEKGNGVLQDLTEAAKCYRKAADQGNKNAQDLLGHCYRDGKGVPQDFTEAIKWFRKAADNGWPPAQWSLGKMYQDGKGVARDLSEAIKWLLLAADGLNVGSIARDLASLRRIAKQEELQEGERRYREIKPNH